MSTLWDLIIIGSGPAGYSAGVYASRARLKVLLLGGETFGGQLMLTTDVENFPGFSSGIMGPKLMMEMREQASKFGTNILDVNVTRVDFKQKNFKVYVGDQEYRAKSILIATGAESLTLGLENEKEYYGRGVSTCAVCDAAFYRDKEVYVVGGGDSAVEDTMALTKFARHVNVVVRREVLRASKIMQEKILRNPKVTILWNTNVVKLIAEAMLKALIIENIQTGIKQEVKADGIFYAIGHKPITSFLVNAVQLDEKGYILTNLTQFKETSAYTLWKENYPTMTSVEGVFAAGDVVDFRYRQAITSAGMGCMAALDVEKWLEKKNS